MASRSHLPAAPLVAVLERVLARYDGGDDINMSGGASKHAYRELAMNPRQLWAWRTGSNATVTPTVADRILSRTQYLWFDVWPECEVHEEPDRSCATCKAYYRARLDFTGKRIPRAMENRP